MLVKERPFQPRVSVQMFVSSDHGIGSPCAASPYKSRGMRGGSQSDIAQAPWVNRAFVAAWAKVAAVVRQPVRR